MTEKNNCSHCGAALQSTDKFCPSCGRKQEPAAASSSRPASSRIVCASCGVLNPASSDRCYSCGSVLVAAQPSTIQRDSDPSSDDPKKPASGKAKLSFTMQLAIAFALFVIVIVIIEMQTRPAPGTSGGQAGSQQSAQSRPQQDFTGQITMLENAVRADAGNTDALLQLANVLHDAKMYPRAIDTYKQFLKKMPKHTDARVDLGICYFEMGEMDTAVKEIRSAIAIDPKHQMAMFNLGVILLSAGKKDEADQWLQKTIDLDSQSLAGQRAREILHQH